MTHFVEIFLFQKMGTVAEEQYHLRWNDYHSSLTKCFRDLRDNDEMLDVNIISDGRTFKAHKLVLSACSPMFKTMLKKARGHPFLQPIGNLLVKSLKLLIKKLISRNFSFCSFSTRSQT